MRHNHLNSIAISGYYRAWLASVKKGDGARLSVIEKIIAMRERHYPRKIKIDAIEGVEI